MSTNKIQALKIFTLTVALLQTIFLTLTLAVFAAPLQQLATSPIELQAKDILPQALLKGKNYSVGALVRNDGLINTYELKTDYGPLTIESTELLMTRIDELNAMVVMEEMDRQKIFGNSLVAGVKAPFQGAANLITSPVATTKSVVEGAGKFFSNIGRAITSDDPHQDNALKVAIGYDAAKRGFAFELGINPYSSYEPAMDELGNVAQASVAGGIVPRTAMAAVGGDVVTVLRITGTSESMRKLVRDNPPGELEKINRSKLSEMGVSSSVAESFLGNYAYDPQEKTFLVGELENLKGVAGREAFIAAASLVTRQTVASFYRSAAGLMARYHAAIAPAASLGRVGGAPYLRTKDGKVVLVLPLDHIFRTEKVESKLRALNDGIAKLEGVTGKELWITGKVDAGAREMFEVSGWKITETAGNRLSVKLP